jgi:hypothetical protein
MGHIYIPGGSRRGEYLAFGGQLERCVSLIPFLLAMPMFRNPQLDHCFQRPPDTSSGYHDPYNFCRHIYALRTAPGPGPGFQAPRTHRRGAQDGQTPPLYALMAISIECDVIPCLLARSWLYMLKIVVLGSLPTMTFLDK